MFRIIRVLAWALLLLSPLGGAWAAELTPELESRFQEGRTLPVWVYFADKGLNQDDPAALDFAKGTLSARAIKRRAKSRTAENLVDWRDLPLASEYIEILSAGGYVPRNRSRWLNAASFEVDIEGFRRLAEFSFVRAIRPVANSSRDRQASQSHAAAGGRNPDYGGSWSELSQIRVPEVHAMGYRGQGVVIGMLDTGCNTAHEALQDAVVLGVWDFINGDGVISDQSGDPQGQDNHGSRTFSSLAGHKPGTMKGVAYEASFFLAKTEDESDEYPAEEDFWVAGLEWLESQGCDLVNSSVGYYDWLSYSDLDGDTAACTVAADHAASLGLLVVAAVGNTRYDFGHIIAPSDGDSVLAVGAVDEEGEFSWFSAPGPSYDGRIKPDLMARGEDNFLIDPASWSGYTLGDGTSYCTTLSTGVAALILCAHPELGPMDLIEAMRQTADHAGSPDNDYGWGLIDAVAALEYFLPRIEHDPLPDSEDAYSGYPAAALITTRLGSVVLAELHFRVDEGFWLSLPMNDLGDGDYEATIPAQAWDSRIDYYLFAENSLGQAATHPSGAPGAWHSFEVGQDLEPPLIEHEDLGDQAPPLWPALLEAEVTDNLGVASVHCESWLNGQRQQDFALDTLSGDYYSAEFPFSVEEGDSVRYRLVAIDLAQEANSASHPETGEHEFAIRGSGGLVLLLEEYDAPDAASTKLGADKQWLDTEAGRTRSSSADWIEAALTEAGYLVDRRAAQDADPLQWGGLRPACRLHQRLPRSPGAGGPVAGPGGLLRGRWPSTQRRRGTRIQISRGHEFPHGRAACVGLAGRLRILSGSRRCGTSRGQFPLPASRYY